MRCTFKRRKNCKLQPSTIHVSTVSDFPHDGAESLGSGKLNAAYPVVLDNRA